MKKAAIVVGGGIAGVSITRYLAARGLQVTLLEKSPQLCSGATWHAAGLVTRFAGSSKLKKLHSRSLEILTDLHDKYDIRLHTPGSIRLIEKGHPDRYREAMQHYQLARLYDIPGLETRIIDRDEIAHHHPLLDVSGVECGIWTPKDGDVDPTILTNLLASQAKADGAVIKLNHEAIQVDHLPGNRFRMHIRDRRAKETSVAEADIIINAAGLWSKHVTALVDKDNTMTHPAFIIEHQYIITEEIPAIKALSAQGKRLPVLRDLKGSSYIRQERTGLLIGPYEKDCRLRNTPDERGEWYTQPPDDWGMELFADKRERIEESLVHAMTIIPAIETVGFINCTNGPTIWTGDSLARCGRTNIPNYYDFNTLTYGIAQSLPLAEYLGYIILEGEQPWDASAEFDPLRYGPWANAAYTEEKICDTYSKNNVVSYGAYENRSAGRRHIPQPPLYNQLVAKGAVCAFSAGLEVPVFYSNNTKGMNFARFVDHEWHDIAVKEAENVLKNVGLSYASFSKFRVSGTGSTAFLNKLTTNMLPKAEGRSRLTYAATPKGRVAAEFTITKEFSSEGDSYYVVGSRDYALQDFAWMNQHLREWGHRECGCDIRVENLCDEIDILHVAGPNSLAFLSQICPAVSDIPFLQMRPLEIGGHKVNVFRVSFTGERGYEIHFPRKSGPELFELLTSHPAAKAFNLGLFGNYALNGLRIEKGFKVKGDLDYAHYTEAGIEPFVSNKKQFTGQDPSYTPKRRACVFRVHTDKSHAWSVPGDCPVTHKPTNTVIGLTTTSAYGPESRSTIALGYVYTHVDKSLLGDLSISVYGQEFAVDLLQGPPSPVRGRDTD